MRRKNVMLASKFDERRLAKWPRPYILQPKINGRRALIYFDEDGWATIKSSEDHVINSLPELNLQLNHSGLRNVILDGELYNPEWSFQKLCSVVGRTNNVHPDHKAVKFYCFDMVSDEEQFRRLASLGGITIIAQQLPNFVKVPSYIGNDIESYLDNFIADGFEGIIIRHQRGLYEPLRSTYMMKLKVRKIARFIITGFEEAFSIHGEAKNELGAFWLKTETNEEFKVGSGFTQQQRDDFWQADPKDLLNHNCEIYYQELSERGVPIFPIFRHLC